MAAVQTASLFRALPGWENHKTTFEDYKLRGVLPDFYGRDAALSLPDIHHIHLAQTTELAQHWARRYPTHERQHLRTTRIGDPDNDFWLVYAYDDLDDRYLLLSIVGPDAHNDAHWRSFLSDLLIYYVDPWIKGRLDCAE
ncbi:MAG: hypothetical protein CMI01_15005 [Oceanospirillaceae bacterium]|nr:hypothetical protein [Oceanospirillaceae bacterium]